MEIHGQIGVFPIAGDAQTLEFLALHVDPTAGELATFGAEFIDRHLILVAALLAVLLFDLPFDRQAVAVPARDVARVIAHHLMAAHNHVLDRLVQRVTDVQMPVGIGRAVMQREGLTPLFLAQAVIDADLLPPLQPAGLALGQSGAHGEIGLGQVQRGFVVGGLGAHGERPLGIWGLFNLGRCEWLKHLGPASQLLRAPGI